MKTRNFQVFLIAPRHINLNDRMERWNMVCTCRLGRVREEGNA